MNLPVLRNTLRHALPHIFDCLEEKYTKTMMSKDKVLSALINA
jgi:hypothetical protein